LARLFADSATHLKRFAQNADETFRFYAACCIAARNAFLHPLKGRVDAAGDRRRTWLAFSEP